MSQIKYTLFIYNCIQHPKGHRKSILKTYYMDAQNRTSLVPKIGNRAGLGQATPTPFPSQLFESLSHPSPKPGAGQVNVSRSRLQ